MKIAGLSVVGTLLATLLYYLFEFGWYSILQSTWQAGEGVSPEDYTNQSGAWMALGVVAPLLQVIAIGLILKWSGWPSLSEAFGKIFSLSVLLGVAVGIYALVYLPQHSVPLFLIDTIHYIIGWSVTAIVLTYFRPKYVAPITKHGLSENDGIEDIYE